MKELFYNSEHLHENDHFIHINIVLFFMSLSFSLILHMLYNLLQKNKAIRIPFFPYVLYLYPIAMPIFGLLEQFIIGHPGYYRENGIVLFNLYFAFVMYAINLLLLALGIKYAKTTKFKHFFKTTMLFTVLCIVRLLAWHAGMKLLKENDYIKGFEIQYVEQEQERCVSIDASRVYIDEEIFYYFMIHDMTLEHQQAKMSHYLAYHDPLTGI